MALGPVEVCSKAATSSARRADAMQVKTRLSHTMLSIGSPRRPRASDPSARANVPRALLRRRRPPGPCWGGVPEAPSCTSINTSSADLAEAGRVHSGPPPVQSPLALLPSSRVAAPSADAAG
ncbi:unnamed protein product, partial [Prorocentrum cordatum]